MILFDPNFISPSRASEIYEELLEDTEWVQEFVTVYGNKYKVPRLLQWFGDEGRTYSWSGISLNPLPWTPLLQEIRDLVQKRTNHNFNSVLMNYYRDGNDTVGWHSDNEPELGKKPFIASVSFGATRDFVLRKIGEEHIKQTYPSSNGSLITMDEDTQMVWQHSLPRRKSITKGRINLTFRYTY